MNEALRDNLDKRLLDILTTPRLRWENSRIGPGDLRRLAVLNEEQMAHERARLDEELRDLLRNEDE